MVKDLVCGMEVSEDSLINAEYKGKTYYFCSSNCQAEFKINPKKFVK